MQSSLLRKMEKSIRYAEQKERVSISRLCANFHGNHSDHQVEFDRGAWSCSCAFFSTYGRCAHTMAMERILDSMLQNS